MIDISVKKLLTTEWGDIFILNQLNNLVEAIIGYQKLRLTCRELIIIVIIIIIIIIYNMIIIMASFILGKKTVCIKIYK